MILKGGIDLMQTKKVFLHHPSTLRSTNNYLTGTTSKFPKNCSMGRIWLLSSSGKMVALVSLISKLPQSCLPPVQFLLQSSHSSLVCSLFSFPSSPSRSGDSEHRVLPGDRWHSQMMQEPLLRDPPVWLSPQSAELLSGAEFF